MQMHDGNTESSVLFCLNELRGLESDRREGERQARLAAERAALAEEERRWREAEAERAHAAQLRLEEELCRRELEQRIALRAQLAREQARVDAEARASVALRQSSPWPRLVVVTAALMGVVAGGVFYYMRATDAELARQRALADAREQREAAQLAAREKSSWLELATQLDGLRAQLKVPAATAEEPAAPPSRPVVKAHRHAPARRKPAPVVVTQPMDKEAEPLGLPE